MTASSYKRAVFVEVTAVLPSPSLIVLSVIIMTPFVVMMDAYEHPKYIL